MLATEHVMVLNGSSPHDIRVSVPVVESDLDPFVLSFASLDLVLAAVVIFLVQVLAKHEARVEKEE